jgi:hypothetical protein
MTSELAEEVKVSLPLFYLSVMGDGIGEGGIFR